MRTLTRLLMITLLACGKDAPPAPVPATPPTTAAAVEPKPKPAAEPMAREHRFVLDITDGGVPREMRVTSTMPADWKFDDNSGGRFVRFDHPRGLVIVWLKAERVASRSPPSPDVREVARGGNAEWQLYCQIHAPGDDAPAAALEAARAGCEAATATVMDTVLDPALIAAEEPKLAGCPAASQVSYTRTTPATNGEPSAFGAVAAARAFWTSGGKVEVVLADYEVANWNRGMRPAEPGQAALEIEIAPDVGKEVGSGRVPLVNAWQETSRATATLYFASGRTWADWDDRAGAESWVEVIARTDKKVCGRFQLADGAHKATGEFVADLHIGRPD